MGKSHEILPRYIGAVILQRQRPTLSNGDLWLEVGIMLNLLLRVLTRSPWVEVFGIFGTNRQRSATTLMAGIFNA